MLECRLLLRIPSPQVYLCKLRSDVSELVMCVQSVRKEDTGVRESVTFVCKNFLLLTLVF